MYDLRILFVWLILGFLLYLMAIRPEQRWEKETNEKSQNFGDYSFPRSNGQESTELVKRLKESCILPCFKPNKDVMMEIPSFVLPQELIIDRGVFPIKVEGDMITLAMIDPFDLQTVDEIRQMTGQKIETVEISPSDFVTCVKWMQDKKEEKR